MTTAAARADAAPFEVHLDVFAGPFEVLLRLITKHELDVTEVALAQVTDEFMAYLRAAPFDLGEATEFLVVASTLLSLKASRLLPAPVADDEEDLALLEERDLLFARLLQYRAYKQAAALLGQLMQDQRPWIPRMVGLPAELAAALPEVVLGVGPQRLAALAAAALRPRQPPEVSIEHVHAPRVSVREHAAIVLERLQELGAASFATLCSDCREVIEVVARFLALLDLYRDGRVAFAQSAPLGELQVAWQPDDGAGAPGEYAGG